jgi:7,8-dihydropterin-6-yl-methyl-4-(beta-D-ribofuranosyl)aminobenzene 5'-phosphate synthase
MTMKKIICVVENTARRGSPFWGEHGLSYVIESDHGCVLFDTGQTGSVLLHNLALLGRSLTDIDALILSHAHHDHTGGLAIVLSQRPGLPIHASPDIFRPRYSFRDNRPNSIGLRFSSAEFKEAADLHLNDESVEVISGVWTTGEIRDRAEPEGRSAQHFIFSQGRWEADPYQDDMSVVVEVEEGLVVICGCCHAGLLNTLAHVRSTFKRPILDVIGGTHLTSADQTQLQHVITLLRKEYGPPRFYVNHCTGERAYVALAHAFGDRVQPFPAGAALTFA